MLKHLTVAMIAAARVISRTRRLVLVICKQDPRGVDRFVVVVVVAQVAVAERMLLLLVSHQIRRSLLLQLLLLLLLLLLVGAFKFDAVGPHHCVVVVLRRWHLVRVEHLVLVHFVKLKIETILKSVRLIDKLFSIISSENAGNALMAKMDA